MIFFKKSLKNILIKITKFNKVDRNGGLEKEIEEMVQNQKMGIISIVL